MKIRKKTIRSRFEAIHQRLTLDIFRHVIRDNAFGMDYNYLSAPAPQRVAESKAK